jgi:N-acetylmuramoyl-L-alanine amidase
LSLLGSLVLAGALWGAEAGGTRAAPTRPGAAKAKKLPERKFGRVEYVRLAEVARELDLKITQLDRGRKVLLSDGALRAEIEADSREITVNGLRVFLGDPTNDAGGQIYVSQVDYERCLTPLLRPGRGMAARAQPKTIVLDPGHGGNDSGTSANEKVYALDVARRARGLLEAAGYKVVLTREKDEYLELKERSAIANANRADLFVSIHFNALVNNNRTSGVEVYTFAPQNQRSSDAWSPGEKNDIEDFASPVNRFDHWSVALSHAIHRRFVVDLKASDRGKKLMHLGVLRGLACPGVLVECGFLTSTTEARKIATAAYRQDLAEAIAKGVRDYAATLKTAAGR